MRIGISLFCQNYQDWNPGSHRGVILPTSPPDWRVYDEHLRLGDLADPLGFDAIWSVEHHFTPYTMVPDVLQFLTYFAARTQRVDLGTMIIVVPWHHNPVRVAEELAMLDIMLQGRKIFLGFGRGISHVEFSGMGIPMGESRGRQHEGIEVIRRALTQRSFAYQGKYFQIPEMTIRPQPRSAPEDLWDQAYMAWGSPETLRYAAENRLGLLITQGALERQESYGADLDGYNAIRASKGWAPKYPKVVVWVLCGERKQAVEEESAVYLRQMGDSVTRHYEFNNPDRFRGIPGYEGYLKGAEELKAKGEGSKINLYVAGPPDDCIEQLKAVQKDLRAEEFIMVFQYGAMPVEKAERSMRLFAKEVLPEMHRYDASVPAVAARAR
ncbi:MAG: LLM class flavin-dependent oxidoreductase [Dehalococcoidia bacterium]|nr:LLM class flavin-dependent oxidoreductase [Dehalococcoidia bacterium]